MKKTVFLALFLFSALLLFPSSKADLSGKFQKALENQDTETLHSLLDRLKKRVIAPGRLAYNRGIMQRQEGNLQDAAASFREAEENLLRPSLKAQSAYNRGNTLFEQSREEQGDQTVVKMKQAMDAYRDALHWDPNLEDASYNLEWIQKEVEKQEQQNKEDSKNKENSEDEKDEGENQNSPTSPSNNNQSERENSEQQVEQILEQEEERKENAEIRKGGLYEVDKDW